MDSTGAQHPPPPSQPAAANPAVAKTAGAAAPSTGPTSPAAKAKAEPTSGGQGTGSDTQMGGEDILELKRALGSLITANTKEEEVRELAQRLGVWAKRQRSSR